MATTFLWVLPASAQQTSNLQQQLEQLKQQYEQTTQALLQRILVFEHQMIGISKLPEIETTASRSGEKVSDSIWKHPNLLFGVIGILGSIVNHESLES